jgi:catechol 2,3-dioxygenase-like lactoylglutathione lyase family enzyme
VIGYVTLGTNDLGRAAAFYDALLGELGAKRLWEFERGIAWCCAEDQPCLGIMKPFDGKRATAGNGAMVALGVDFR